jgi:uncharacterized protein (TIGR03067 family)
MNSLLLGLAVTVGAPTIKEKPKVEATIVGHWDVESIRHNGNNFVKGNPNGPGTGLRYTFSKDGQWIVHREGQELQLAGGGTRTFTVDAKPNLPAVDLVTTRPGGAESRMIGIFKIEGDSLTICVARGKGVERPTTFDGRDGITIYVLKRAKKE